MQQAINYAALVLSFVAVEDAASEYAGKLTTFANATAMVFVPGMKYADYTSARDAWKKAYAEAKKASEDACDKAFSRAIAKMNDFLSAKGAVTFTAPASDVAKTKANKASKAKADDAKVKALGAVGITANMTSAEANLALTKAKKNVDEDTRAAALAFIGEQAKKERAAAKKGEREAVREGAKALYEFWKAQPLKEVNAELKRRSIAKPSVK